MFLSFLSQYPSKIVNIQNINPEEMAAISETTKYLKLEGVGSLYYMFKFLFFSLKILHGPGKILQIRPISTK